MHSLGFADQDSEETLFYYEHIRARYAGSVTIPTYLEQVAVASTEDNQYTLSLLSPHLAGDTVCSMDSSEVSSG